MGRGAILTWYARMNPKQMYLEIHSPAKLFALLWQESPVAKFSEEVIDQVFHLQLHMRMTLKLHSDIPFLSYWDIHNWLV
jgi:hypothetical protein